MDSRHSDMPDQETNILKLRMRADLIVAMRSHHQRRRYRRNVIATALLVISTGTFAFLMFGRSNMLPPPPVAIHDGGNFPRDSLPQPTPGISGPRHSIITIVRTDPDILQRYVSHPTSKIKSISDETLLASLASIGRPTGLIRYDGRVMLAKDVTDDLKIDDSP